MAVALAARSDAVYPKIPEKGPRASQASLNVFSWIVNNLPFVILAIAVILGVLAVVQRRKDR